MQLIEGMSRGAVNNKPTRFAGKCLLQTKDMTEVGVANKLRDPYPQDLNAYQRKSVKLEFNKFYTGIAGQKHCVAQNETSREKPAWKHCPSLPS